MLIISRLPMRPCLHGSVYYAGGPKLADSSVSVCGERASCWQYCGCSKHAQSMDRCLLTQRVPPASAAAAASAAFRSHGPPASCSDPPLCCAAEASVRTAPSCVLASPLAPPNAAGGAHAADRAALAVQRCLHSPLSIGSLMLEAQCSVHSGCAVRR